jgi:predicted ATP-binding protein involved in virulence
MKLNKISIENFRCFKIFEVDFGIKTTVFIGKNGTGKTNLLTSIVYSLSFPFAGNKMKEIQTIGTSNPDLKIAEIDTKGKLDARFDSEKNDFIYPLIIENNATFDNEKLEWTMLKEKKAGGLSYSKYKDAFEKFQHFYNDNKNEKKMPIFAYFTDSFPHKEASKSQYVKNLLKSDQILPRNFGYYKWDEKNNCTEIWKERYINVYLGKTYIKNDIEELEEQIEILNTWIDNKDELDKHKVFEWEHTIEKLKERIDFLKETPSISEQDIEINYINSKLIDFSSPVKFEQSFINNELKLVRISVDRQDKKNHFIKFTFANGNIIYFDQLPMGYKRIFSIVLDITYRSYILNKNNEPTGIVIIDEIELHLHPTLQQEILQRLQKTFPNIQFIVTTHSPLVISNFKSDENNKIIKLIHDGNNYSNETVENIYGIDYTTGLMEIMGAKYRASSIDNLIDSIVILASKNRLEDAEKMKKELYAIVGDNNAHIKTEIESRIEMNKK